jgi:lipopolysaccharide transport system ATP-binding protein
MPTVISVEHLSKIYRLGQIGTGTFSRDLGLWWAKARGKPNPLLRIGETDHGNRDGEDLWALRDINFTVRQGEVLGIIGRNGAGKSTLLKILSRVTAPTSGKIKVKGRVASLLEVGTGFHPELTGRENVYLNGAILGMTRQEVTRKFDEIVDFAGIEKFIDTPVKRYSSGMYVRLAFAVAAHLEPEILLVDEVLAVGDAEFQKKCLGKMSNVAYEGRTVLFVSHNMVAIEQICKSGILISSGLIDKIGEVNTIIEHYIGSSGNLSKSVLENISNTKIKLVDFCITDKNKNVLDLIKLGDSLTFLMTVFSKSEAQNIKIGIGINNDRNLRITTLHNEISGFPLFLKSGESTIACHVPIFNLVEGIYNLDIKIYSGLEPILFAQNFFQFRVHPGNFYKSGKLPDSSWGGICYLQQSWEANS